MNRKLIMAAALALSLTACTDAEKAAFGTYGNEQTVSCYSGGQKIFEDASTGAVLGSEAGVYFKSKSTGKMVQTYADCIVVAN